ncbi:unnamed protein product [Discula destructiva]
MLSGYRLAVVGVSVSLFFTRGLGSPFQHPANTIDKRGEQLALNRDFPDPSIEQDWDGTWYAFATSNKPNGNCNIQVATASSPDGPWTWLDQDALPDSGSWTTGKDNWAPDVKRMPPTNSGRYIMTYSGELASDSVHHCIGIATSSSITGPYTPQDGPVICPDVSTTGGAIDSYLYYDEPQNKRYLVYKEDGTGLDAGTCPDLQPPYKPTPILLQEMDANDWITPVGSPVQILDRQDEDGPLVEAPAIIRASDGTYLLFYSSHCYNDVSYDVKYAVATSITGPYTRKGSLLKTGQYDLQNPGGASPTPGGDVLLFHADCALGFSTLTRCLHTVNINFSGGSIQFT